MRKYFQDIVMIGIICAVAACLLALAEKVDRYSDSSFDGCNRTDRSVNEQGFETRSILGWHHWNCWKKDKDAPTAEEQAKYDAEVMEHYEKLSKLSIKRACSSSFEKHVRIETIDDRTGKALSTTDECLWYGLVR